jgi:hypothetical protein
LTKPPFDRDVFLARYEALDKALVAAEFPPTSPWWMAEIRRFIQAKKRRWVIRAGRRAGKSSTLARLAVCWALWGAWYVPPGDTAVVPFVSVNKDEAAARLRTIVEILKSLKAPFEQRGLELELPDRRVVFRVYACTTKATVGFTSIAVFGDEVARWESADTGANPAKEVVGSLAPTLATQKHGFLVLSSSPWGREDYHHESFEVGDNDAQAVSFAETWVANPTLTEEDTHGLESDPRTWLREYAAVPADTVQGDWFGAAIEAATSNGPAPPLAPGHRAVVAIDAAFVRDRFAYAVVSSRVVGRDQNGRAKRITYTHEVGAWKPDREPSEMARRLKKDVCSRYDQSHRELSTVYADQHEGSSFRELAKHSGILLEIVPWTGGNSEKSKSARFRAVRLAMLEGSFKIPNDPTLIKELRAVRGVMAPSGSERIEVHRTSQGHGDRVSALCLAGSIALERAASEADPGPDNRERMVKHKADLAKKILEKRAKEWSDNPTAVIRRAVTGRA